MLYVLSPAKALDYETPLPEAIAKMATKPRFVPHSAELIDVLAPKSRDEVAALMDLSDDLAELNVGRYAAWSKRFTAKNSRPAVWAFDGDVYGGLAARELSEVDLAWAQQHVAILSGLYGVLRPLDRMQPYRLEMGTRLATARGSDLYAYWGDTISRCLNTAQPRKKGAIVINLASQEYFRAVDRKALKARVIDCVFEDWKNGEYKIISFFAKRARGLMARHAITQRITEPGELESFGAEGYRFAPEASEPDRLVFRRRVVAG